MRVICLENLLLRFLHKVLKNSTWSLWGLEEFQPEDSTLLTQILFHHKWLPNVCPRLLFLRARCILGDKLPDVICV